MNTWIKTNKRTIDQRGTLLPPTWCPRPPGAPPPIASGGVLRSDPSRALARTLVAAIETARDVVVAAAFLLADVEIETALLRVAQRRVRVYVLLATETRLDKERAEGSSFEKRALADQKRMLETLAGWALIRSAPSFHAKALLVDPQRGGPGYLLTANLTVDALERNEELAIELTAKESKAVFAHLGWAMWEAAVHEVIEPGRLGTVARPLGEVPAPEPDASVVATLGERGTLAAAAVKLVRSAKKQVTVASFGWDADHEIVQALCAKANAGVDVVVLARVRQAAMPALMALAEAGARIVGYPWFHAKAIVADGSTAMVMSANMQAQGFDRGIELGILLDRPRAAAVQAIVHGWTESAPFELRVAPRLGEVLGAAEVWRDGELRKFIVAPRAEITGDPVVAAADGLESEPPVPRGPFGLPLPVHQLEITWEVRAPRLAEK